MRLYFPNTTRPKKAAKHLSSGLRVPLAQAQVAVAHACGYEDWYDLEKHFSDGSPFVLDQHLSGSDYVELQKRLTLLIGEKLDVSNGDVQFALTRARLSGDRRTTIEEQIAIRVACWRETIIPLMPKREPGAVGKLKSPGRNGEIVILRRLGQPTQVISQRGVTIIADFEYVSPQVAPALFIPRRLYLPYGFWTERDGARIVFSRDYAPMWRLREGKPAERVEPWLRIQHVDQTFLWPDRREPYWSEELTSHLHSFLNENGVFALPVLADALPLLVHDNSIQNIGMEDSIKLLKSNRNALAEAG